VSEFVLDRDIAVTVNGRLRASTVSVRTSLADFLRHGLGLTGTHIGCEQGACGTCTVILNGEAVRSCLVLAVQADGAEVTSIEGVDGTGENGLHPLQESFREHHALQCGFCTPGMILAALDLLRRHPDPTEEVVREDLAGNLGRCTGYEGLVDAVLDAAVRMRP
jgi:carbon-monoxide dehydrogenase small subunit